MNDVEEIVRFDAKKICSILSLQINTQKHALLKPSLQILNTSLRTQSKMNSPFLHIQKMPVRVATHMKKCSIDMSRVAFNLRTMDTIKTVSTQPSAANTQRECKSSLSWFGCSRKKIEFNEIQIPKPMGDTNNEL